MVANAVRELMEEGREEGRIEELIELDRDKTITKAKLLQRLQLLTKDVEKVIEEYKL